jgi:hypothetical protein
MGLFGFVGKNIALIDIRSSSVGAGFVGIAKNKAPVLAYTTRKPLEVRMDEPIEMALGRTLGEVLHTLVAEGAPLLRAATGSGKTDAVFVTATAPWEQSRVFTHTVDPEHPFVFSKQHVEEAATHAPELPADRTRVSQLVIATLLNGYEVHDPFGKRVRRAELIMMSSAIDTTVMDTVERSVRGALHQHRVEFDAFIPNAYSVLRDLYQHQRDFLIIDIGGDSTNVLLAKHGLLLSSACIPHGMSEITRAARAATSPTAPEVEKAEVEWLNMMGEALGKIAKEEPLPRTVFLFAEEPVRDFLKKLLDAPQLRPLWLSEESLAILPVLPTQFAPFLTHTETVELDPALSILALAAQQRFG